jgi:mRNA interferase RelE/StbE
MEIKYRKIFLKDLSILPKEYRTKIEKLVFEIIPKEKKSDILQRISKMAGYDVYYKIRIGMYRIGVKVSQESFEFQRVMHRKDIYKFFP